MNERNGIPVPNKSSVSQTAMNLTNESQTITGISPPDSLIMNLQLNRKFTGETLPPWKAQSRKDMKVQRQAPSYRLLRGDERRS